jgi:hypothetical protein
MSEYFRCKGPAHKPNLPISYWYSAWWGLSPWATPFWVVSRGDGAR